MRISTSETTTHLRITSHSLQQQHELLIAADTSPYGVGAALSHRMPDGTEQTVTYASRSLSPAKRRYSQLDKEALSIIFGVTKFCQYLLGCHFVILSDHKPLSYLMASNKPIPAMASARIQHWSLLLSSYDYSICHPPGKANANADTFNRLPLATTPTEDQSTGDTVLLFFECIQVLPLSVSDVRTGTDREPLLDKVRTFVLQGWSLHLD